MYFRINEMALRAPLILASTIAKCSIVYYSIDVVNFKI